jgi:hypothetical protein
LIKQESLKETTRKKRKVFSETAEEAEKSTKKKETHILLASFETYTWHQDEHISRALFFLSSSKQLAQE